MSPTAVLCEGDAVNCSTCGEEVVRKKIVPNARGVQYCSRACFWQARIVLKHCSFCGIAFRRHGRPRRARVFCSRLCFRKANSAQGHYHWGGGRTVSAGYINLRTGTGKARREHIVIAEHALGRPLRKGEVIHHIDGNKVNNRNSNLLICSASFHRWLHNRMAALYQRDHFSYTASM